MDESPMRVLVTGCSRGIGRATAAEFAARGHHVVASAREVAMLADLDVAACVELDVTDGASVERAIAEVGGVDALVNNAGATVRSPVETAPLDEVERLWATNVAGPLRLIQAVLPAMRSQGFGVIVNVSSVFGRLSWPLMGPYSMTKFALEGLSEALHLEVGHFGVHTVLVEPGYVAPGMTAVTYGAGSAAYAPLFDEVARTFERSNAESALPDGPFVASAIADAVEARRRGEDLPLRLRVGDQAELALGARASLDDAAFESALRDLFGFRW